MSILISGSLAYDYIMDFPDSFKNHILPDQIHILNVCFVVDELKKNLGGTAGNIAYTMKLLGGEPLILGVLGTDAKDYLEALKKQNIETARIRKSEQRLSASAHITTDKDDNQITAFYSGAGEEGPELSLDTITENMELAIIAPSKKETMIKHAKEAYERNIPIVLDPGQQITALSGREMAMLMGQAHFLIANDYEMKLIQEKTGWDASEMLEHVDVLVTTLGEKGSRVAKGSETIEIQACKPHSVDDPTGAGDAYRAGFFAAYAKGHDLKTCGQAGSVAASYAIEQYGTQNHSFTIDEFSQRYKDAYKENFKF
ncbi:MAG: carbohydrate kinase family protein [Candidatus Magasanikbacteria bacterium]|nr:carbohydrate kinase family protein [Candidatus Magasanikbacteria bacterium]